MIRRTRILHTILAAGAIGLASCGQSPPAADAEFPPTRTEDARPAVEVVKADRLAVEEVVKVEPPAPLPDGGTFPFPDDSGGKALARTLAPAIPPAMPARESPPAPKVRELPAPVVSPAPAFAGPPDAPPRLVVAGSRPAQPVPLPDRVPADLGGVIPPLPERPALATGPLTRTEGPDVARPVDLPLLSPRPLPDRAPLTDPTLEFTARSVVSPMLPLRTAVAGFLRINLPDPFENAAEARLRTPVEENPNRTIGVGPLPPR